MYKALHSSLEKVVALKVLPRDRLTPQAISRFKREMKAVGKLDHQYIVRATDAGEAEGDHFLVMEYVDGVDLSELLRRVGPLPAAEACELIRQSLAAVALLALFVVGIFSAARSSASSPTRVRSSSKPMLPASKW